MISSLPPYETLRYFQHCCYVWLLSGPVLTSFTCAFAICGSLLLCEISRPSVWIFLIWFCVDGRGAGLQRDSSTGGNDCKIPSSSVVEADPHTVQVVCTWFVPQTLKDVTVYLYICTIFIVHNPVTKDCCLVTALITRDDPQHASLTLKLIFALYPNISIPAGMRALQHFTSKQPSMR